MFVAEVFCEKKIVLEMPDLSFYINWQQTIAVPIV